MPAVKQADPVSRRLAALENRFKSLEEAFAGFEPHRNRSVRETLAKVHAAVSGTPAEPEDDDDDEGEAE